MNGDRLPGGTFERRTLTDIKDPNLLVNFVPMQLCMMFIICCPAYHPGQKHQTHGSTPASQLLPVFWTSLSKLSRDFGKSAF